MRVYRPVLAFLLVGACASAPPPPPANPSSRGLRATDHLDEARRQDELAHQASMSPDHPPDPTLLLPLAEPMPWMNATAAEHEQLAQIHRSAAAKMHAEYDEACHGRDAATIEVSPLQKYAMTASNTANGADLLLAKDAGPVDKLLGDMRCHRAWMMLGPTDMSLCPLDLAGIHVTARETADAIEVAITADDPRVVDELQHRTAHELEMAASMHHH